MEITLKAYPSRCYPLLASWKIGNVTYTDVFENEEHARTQLSSRFGNVDFVRMRFLKLKRYGLVPIVICTLPRHFDKMCRKWNSYKEVQWTREISLEEASNFLCDITLIVQALCECHCQSMIDKLELKRQAIEMQYCDNIKDFVSVGLN